MGDFSIRYVENMRVILNNPKKSQKERRIPYVLRGFLIFNTIYNDEKTGIIEVFKI